MPALPVLPVSAVVPAALAAPAPGGAGGWAVRVAPAAAVPGGPRLPLAFGPWLFGQPAHQALQAAGPVLGFFLENEVRGTTDAVFYARLDAAAGAASSPGQAPFGGVQAVPGLPAAAWQLFLAAIETTLVGHGIRHLRLRPPAFCYHPGPAAAQAETLRRRGYRVSLAEQNYALDLARPYAPHLHSSEQRRLAKCYRHGLRFEQEPPLLLPLAHAFVAACRAERGQAPPLPLARLAALFQQFPREHFLFSVRQPDGAWAALTVAIRVDDRVLYNFYPASPLRCNGLSPVVMLTEGLHHFGQANGFAVLDLGTSTLADGPNASLLRFKRHLGASAGLRLTWEREILL